MFDRHQIGQDFSRASAQYDAHAHLQQQVLRSLWSRLAPLVNEDSLILDAGCGTGQLAREVRRNIVQLDIAPAMCARAVSQGIPAVNGTIAALPFAEHCFDAVFSSLALQWVEDWQAALQEMERVVKPGGVVAVSTFGANTLRELRESFASADAYPHVSSFIDGGAFERETVTEYVPDLAALMRHLKHIGARNKLSARRKSLFTKRQMQQVERYYRDRFGEKQGLPVTWEILYSVKRK